MRIVQLTAGTGSFFCGTCLRDNALVLALRRQGHDVRMVPLYLPMHVGPVDASEGAPIYFGGINTYLQQGSSFFRALPRWLDRMLDARSVLGLAAKKAGMTEPADLGALTISVLRGQDGHQRKEVERLCRFLERGERPDVVCLSNALLAGLAEPLRERLGVPVVCTLQGEDGFLDAMPDADRALAWEVLAERAVHVDAFVAVSAYHGELMGQRLSLEPERVHVVRNGIDPDEIAPRQAPPEQPTIGYLARMCHDKGLHVLVDAFIALRGRWPEGKPAPRLLVAGVMNGIDVPYVERLRARLDAAGLGAAVEFRPNLTHEQKLAFFAELTVFSVPAVYSESFGLYAVEAMAAGVPVVLPDHAALPELVRGSGAGLLSRHDDAEDLARALVELLGDPAMAAEMGARARASARNDYHVDRMATEVAAVFQKVSAAAAARSEHAAG
ncbi:MAG: glycosyltransferase family 4 protein [Deltaproteobacteria bacterium]|nr:glycosyltransferase family 4 protein [Deltaproteobacteria bacterium]